jgi:hypothetical protein
LKNRLFIVEGLPCSGKSTTSKKISEFLSRYNIDNENIEEGNLTHPADYEFHSYIQASQINELDSKIANKVKKYGKKALNGYIFPLKMACDDLSLLINYKIYDFLPWDVEKEVMLDKWKVFSKQVNKDKTYIFNCCMIQNPMCETMMRFNFPLSTSKTYIDTIFNIVQELNPLLIYLKVEDVKSRVKEISEKRDKKWLESVISYHQEGKFAKDNDFNGFDGYIKCLEERQKRELEIIDSLKIDKKVILNPFFDWESSLGEIKSFIKEKNF